MSGTTFGRVMVLGSRGMVGSAIMRRLVQSTRVSELIGVNRSTLDLSDQEKTSSFISQQRPDWLILSAAKVGGINANNIYPRDFLYENLIIQLNVIEGAYRAGVEKLIFLGSSCIYPKFAKQPIPESALLTGALEPTNEAYAIAKITGIKLCEAYNKQYGTDYRSIMPTNLYGPGDNYDPDNSHVIPGLIQRFHRAKMSASPEVRMWGTGTVRREFLHVNDLADAVLLLMACDKQKFKAVTGADGYHLNVGTGTDITINELAILVAQTIGYEGAIKHDESMPDGTPRKLLDITKISELGWAPLIELKDGLQSTYRDFLNGR